ncbi:Putative uncharacterized protein [Halomonas sp. R57-5]|uniref:hypothetical protein n=1 Tax=Halomonas sp. R57-5 TaxID=1610576 RepID=UPI0005FC7FF9|nr:hypothetical protein [Halomonas sp. R57-5]CEP35443.1 Putative uncharacterized protein [Halomonas sp. R57-5]
MRHENILAAFGGGLELNQAIQCTRDSLNQQWEPSKLVITTDSEAITLALEERHSIGKVVREILEARLSVLESETEQPKDHEKDWKYAAFLSKEGACQDGDHALADYAMAAPSLFNH